ncbi:MAG: CAP domain-containing protein [Polyangiaceae bacterium]
MIKISHLGSLSILAMTAIFAYSGCASVDTDEEDPQADDIEEADLGEAQDELVYSCSNVSNTKWPAGWKDLETALIKEVNKKRAEGVTCKNGGWKKPVDALTLNTKLRCAARSHAKDLAVSGSPASHTGSDGTNEVDRAKQAGYVPYQDYVNENASGGQTVVANLVTNYINSSSTHCKTMMDPIVKNIGVGYYKTTGGTIRWVMDVGKPQP